MTDPFDPYLGFWTPDRCECGGNIMRNAIGNIWCTNCPFHIRHGKLIASARRGDGDEKGDGRYSESVDKGEKP